MAYTIPPIASVGLREEQVIAAGIRFRKTFGQTQKWYSSRRIGESHSGFKILIDEASGQIVGAHLLGHNAGIADQSVYDRDAVQNPCGRVAKNDLRLPDPWLQRSIHAVKSSFFAKDGGDRQKE